MLKVFFKGFKVHHIYIHMYKTHIPWHPRRGQRTARWSELSASSRRVCITEIWLKSFLATGAFTSWAMLLALKRFRIFLQHLFVTSLILYLMYLNIFQWLHLWLKLLIVSNFSTKLWFYSVCFLGEIEYNWILFVTSDMQQFSLRVA